MPRQSSRRSPDRAAVDRVARRRPPPRGASRGIATSCGGRSISCRRDEAVLLEHRDEVVMRVDRPRPLAQRRLGGRSQSLRRLRRSGARAVSVHGAAARVRRRHREVRHGRAETARPAAVARGRGVRQPAPRVRGLHQGQQPYATSDVVLFAAVASHYIQDAHQPFHASNNYDGQLTGQQRHPLALRARSVRALRIASDDHARPPRCRHLRATRHSRCCSPAISWSTPLLRGRQGRHRRQGRLRRRLLRSVLRDGPADAREAARGGDHGDRRRSSSARGSRPASRS